MGITSTNTFDWYAGEAVLSAAGNNSIRLWVTRPFHLVATFRHVRATQRRNDC